MYVGNGMLLVLNLPLISIWVKILKVPYAILFPLILLFCLIGSYTLSNSIADIVVMIIFGVIGYFTKKFEFEGAPLVFALVLGPLFENALRQSLLMSNGDLAVFVKRPISAGLLVLAGALLVMAFLFKHRPGKDLRED